MTPQVVCMGCKQMMIPIDKWGDDQSCGTCDFRCAYATNKNAMHFYKVFANYIIIWYWHRNETCIFDPNNINKYIKIHALIKPDPDEKYIRMLLTMS